MEKTVRGGLIGCGFFAENHLSAWRDLDGVEIVAVCDLDRSKAEEAAKRFGILSVYNDARQMLVSEDLDFLDIATTPPSHRSLVELAASHYVPVICQKPLANNVEDAAAMVDACAQRGISLMVHENFRWQAPLMAVRQAIEDGQIGTPFFGRLTFRHDYDSYTHQPYLAEAERFIILDLGIHLLDLARVYFGEVARLTCTTQRINPHIKGEDAATMLLEHRTGVTSIIDCSFSSQVRPNPFPQTSVEVDGSGGTIRLTPGYDLKVVSDGRTSTRNVDAPVRPWMTKPWHVIQDSVLNIQRHWVECLLTKQIPATSGADNLRTLVLGLAAYDSAARGQTVQIVNG